MDPLCKISVYQILLWNALTCSCSTILITDLPWPWRSNSRSRSLQLLHQPTCWGRVWPGCRPSFGRNFTSKMWVLTKMVYLRPHLSHVPQHKYIYFFSFPHQKNMGKVSERIKFEGAQLLSAHGRGTGRANLVKKYFFKNSFFWYIWAFFNKSHYGYG